MLLGREGTLSYFTVKGTLKSHIDTVLLVTCYYSSLVNLQSAQLVLSRSQGWAEAAFSQSHHSIVFCGPIRGWGGSLSSQNQLVRWSEGGAIEYIYCKKCHYLLSLVIQPVNNFTLHFLLRQKLKHINIFIIFDGVMHVSLVVLYI